MYSEDDLVMISALQRLLFCPRQCALIHVEQQWTENRLTAEGRILHERVHSTGSESRTKIRVEFDVPIRSLRLGLVGRADIVEFHRQENGTWQPFPVEYKRGRPKQDDSDRVQLCAQALCLEEMLNREVKEGALYYGQKKRRQKESVNLPQQVAPHAGAWIETTRRLGLFYILTSFCNKKIDKINETPALPGRLYIIFEIRAVFFITILDMIDQPVVNDRHLHLAGRRKCHIIMVNTGYLDKNLLLFPSSIMSTR